MATRESSSTARRRLDFRQRRPPIDPPILSRANSRSQSSSFTESLEIVTQASVKQAADFNQSARLPLDPKNAQQAQDDAHTQEVRALIAQGLPIENQAQYDAIVRESLARRADKLLADEAWIFQPEQDKIEV